MKNLLYALALSASMLTMHTLLAEATTIEDAGVIKDLTEPCTDTDNSWRLTLSNKTDQEISGFVYFALENHDDSRVEFKIPKGKLLVLHSCTVTNRLSMLSKAAFETGTKYAAEGLSTAVDALSPVPIPKELIQKALDLQTSYAVCFKKLEVKYTRTVGGNAFSTRPAKVETKTYTHNFGNIGLACYNVDGTLVLSNGDLVLQDARKYETWPWSSVQ
jgi:hypothetical protein